MLVAKELLPAVTLSKARARLVTRDKLQITAEDFTLD